MLTGDAGIVPFFKFQYQLALKLTGTFDNPSLALAKVEETPIKTVQEV